MSKLTYYMSEELSDKVTRITSLSGEFLYLLKGENKALLIDTCLGVGNLRDFVEQLTDKPITVILTHGHVDHAMGAPEFDQVYMNSADRGIYQEHKSLEVRKGYIQMSLKGDVPLIEDADYVQPKEPDFKNLKDGMVFELGGLMVVIYEAPGHTPGSVAVLIKEERALLLGDACNTFTFLFDEHTLSVEDYKDSLLRLDERTKGKYDKVFLSHGFGTAPKEMLSSVVQVCQEIMEGKTDDVPFDFMEYKAYIAKAIGADMKRIDGGLGNIIYRKENVFSRK